MKKREQEHKTTTQHREQRKEKKHIEQANIGEKPHVGDEGRGNYG